MTLKEEWLWKLRFAHQPDPGRTCFADGFVCLLGARPDYRGTQGRTGSNNRRSIHAAGVKVAAGADKQASGPLQIQSYTLEEVTLPRPFKLGQGTVENVLRLTVTLGIDLHEDFTIFVDDEPKQAAVTQRHGVSSVFFSPQELEDGAKISVAIGGGCNTRLLSTMKSRLQLPEGRKLPRRAEANQGFGVKKLRSVPALKGARDQRNEVEIHLTTPVAFPVSNELLVAGWGHGSRGRRLRL